jgi:hypothetical protein
MGQYEAFGRPNVVYIIKAKLRGNPSPPVDSPVRGFDVYEVRLGQRITNRPTLTYSVG